VVVVVELCPLVGACKRLLAGLELVGKAMLEALEALQ
jgi:hypothetical protein